jgi:hypothetical protein
MSDCKSDRGRYEVAAVDWFGGISGDMKYLGKTKMKEQKLYTAAEARRIDIERGGEGKIKVDGGSVYEFDEDKLAWFYIDADNGARFYAVFQYDIYVSKNWLPLTPEPEQPWSDKSELELKIEQLEKELKLLREANDEVHDLLASREKELAEYKNNYHEILADHGELTRKFDELKEKQLSKEDFQLIQIGRLILEVNKRAWELREADL